MCLCFRWQKYTIFLLLLIVEDYFHCFCPVVPPNLFSILPVCDFRGGKANTFGADWPYAARGPHARITPPHCGLRPCAGLQRWYPYGIHPREMVIVSMTTSRHSALASQYLYFSFQQLRKYFRNSFSRGLFCGS